jgi:hypothetical protein
MKDCHWIKVGVIPPTILSWLFVESNCGFHCWIGSDEMAIRVRRPPPAKRIWSYINFDMLLVLLISCASAVKLGPLALPLQIVGPALLDADRNPVKLQCVEWGGFQLHTYIVNGLNVRPLMEIIELVKLKFNCARLPFSLEILRQRNSSESLYISSESSLVGNQLKR